MNRNTKAELNGYKKSSQNFKTKKRWKTSDLKTLKQEFEKGTRLKIIARMLGRTATSISKELSRSGIRIGKYKEYERPRCRGTSNYGKSYIVEISEIINYLENLGYEIIMLHQKSNNNSTVMYKLNNISVSLMRLLIIANKHRLENGLPVFRVRNIP